MIPCLDIGSLFVRAGAARAKTDAALIECAESVGFLQVTGFEPHVDVSAVRRRALKRIFQLPPVALKRLWRQKFAPDHANVYRGWFPLQPGHITAKEGIDVGPDVMLERLCTDWRDPLREPTPLPDEIDLPGWRAVASQHYAEMTHLGKCIMRSLSRGLRLDERYFDALFEQGISTMRFIRYPVLPDCVAPRVVGAPHVDSGLVTLLMQDGISGLEVKARDGPFVEVPIRDDAITINFGRLLSLWSGFRIRATEHRVTGGNQERYSFPFFYEPHADALIEALPGASRQFMPFLYGDFLWQATTRFVEFQGMETLRPPRGDAIAADAAVRALDG